MQYKRINKCHANHHLVGYFLANRKTQLSVTTGSGALIIRSKVKDFGFKSGYEPFEASLEEILYIMNKMSGTYSFDKVCLERFVQLSKEIAPEYHGLIEKDLGNIPESVWENGGLVTVGTKK